MTHQEQTAFENIVGKGESSSDPCKEILLHMQLICNSEREALERNPLKTAFPPFPMFSTLPQTKFEFDVTFILLSAKSFKMDWSKVLSFVNELSVKLFTKWQNFNCIKGSRSNVAKFTKSDSRKIETRGLSGPELLYWH